MHKGLENNKINSKLEGISFDENNKENLIFNLDFIQQFLLNINFSNISYIESNELKQQFEKLNKSLNTLIGIYNLELEQFEFDSLIYNNIDFLVKGIDNLILLIEKDNIYSISNEDFFNFITGITEFIHFIESKTIESKNVESKNLNNEVSVGVENILNII